MSSGGSLPSKVTGFYNVKGKGVDADIKIYGVEKQSDTEHSLYQSSSTDERNNDVKSIIVKTSTLARLSKGATVNGVTTTGLNVKITRVKDLFSKGGSVKGNKNTLISKINKEIAKHKANADYDDDSENMNKIFKQFEAEHFIIDDNEEAFEFILNATSIETLEYLKKCIINKK